MTIGTVGVGDEIDRAALDCPTLGIRMGKKFGEGLALGDLAQIVVSEASIWGLLLTYLPRYLHSDCRGRGQRCLRCGARPDFAVGGARIQMFHTLLKVDQEDEESLGCAGGSSAFADDYRFSRVAGDVVFDLEWLWRLAVVIMRVIGGKRGAISKYNKKLDSNLQFFELSIFPLAKQLDTECSDFLS